MPTTMPGGSPNWPGARTSEEALDALVPRYTVDTAVFTCPGSKDAPLPSGESLRKHKISYAYYMGRRAADAQQVLMSDEQVNTQAKAAGELCLFQHGQAAGQQPRQAGGQLPVLRWSRRVHAAPCALPPHADRRRCFAEPEPQMKIQCSCGAKYSFDVTPAMAQTPVRFVCSACGVDASDMVNSLIRQELGSAGRRRPHRRPRPSRPR